MLKNFLEDPSFFINFHNIGRGLVGGEHDKNNYIRSTKELNCWRIVGNELQKIDEQKTILFDAETYIIQWTLEYIINDSTHEDTLFYYWKGSNASKGFSPLPPEIENQNPVVERICQWSEPALFFHMFPTSLTVLSGSQEKFNPKVKRLFMVRGELPEEIHLYEVPCLKESLRSRGVFVLLDMNVNTIYYWCGSAVPNKYQELVRNIINVKNINNDWSQCKIIEVKDESGSEQFFESLGSTGDYVMLPYVVDFTPRLFYFNSITGDFLATEVEYPLRSKLHTAAFPFLQSHLYTADQPALFLLDNEKEIWLWEGWKTSETDMTLLEQERKLAQETASNYAENKDYSLSIPVKYAFAGREPLDFINIFPYWAKKNGS